MKEYRLSLNSQFVNPRVLRDLSSIGEVESKVNSDGTITILDHSLCFIDEKLEPGTEIFFRMQNWGIARVKSEVLEFRKQAEIARKLEQDRIEQLKLNRSRDALKFHASVIFPVEYHVGIKENLSGLSTNSSGNGWRKDTVYHLILSQPLKDGRLVRMAGDFLCSQSQSIHGANWSGSKDEKYLIRDGTNEPYEPEINCKACLNILKKYRTA